MVSRVEVTLSVILFQGEFREGKSFVILLY